MMKKRGGYRDGVTYVAQVVLPPNVLQEEETQFWHTCIGVHVPQAEGQFWGLATPFTHQFKWRVFVCYIQILSANILKATL